MLITASEVTDVVWMNKHHYLTFRKRITAAGVVLGLTALAPIAQGADLGAAIDLRAFDFDRPDDVRKLYQLLKRAAETACTDTEMSDMRIRTLSWLDCVGDNLEAAIERVDQPALTAYHRAQMPG
jgi:UrcA family protein